jgi:hypothetical protein
VGRAAGRAGARLGALLGGEQALDLAQLGVGVLETSSRATSRPSGSTAAPASNSGFGRFTRAGFDTMTDPCGRDATNHIALKASLIVENANGKLSGPYNLGKPKGCAKPAKKAKAKH